jgi:hypothetical protein
LTIRVVAAHHCEDLLHVPGEPLVTVYRAAQMNSLGAKVIADPDPQLDQVAKRGVLVGHIQD